MPYEEALRRPRSPARYKATDTVKCWFDGWDGEYELKHCIEDNGPILVRLSTDSDFVSHTGVYQRQLTGNTRAKLVRVVGYEDVGGVTEFIAAANYGTGFGDNGWFRFTFETPYVTDWGWPVSQLDTLAGVCINTVRTA